MARKPKKATARTVASDNIIPYVIFRFHEGMSICRFHELSHTFATLALQNGVDVKTVSSMLGHYDAGLTLRTYTHATRQKQDEAAQAMGSFMAQVM